MGGLGSQRNLQELARRDLIGNERTSEGWLPGDGSSRSAQCKSQSNKPANYSLSSLSFPKGEGEGSRFLTGWEQFQGYGV
jgi:hypothetical protein